MTDVVMPQMGESIVEGTLTKWLKKPGDQVERDEPLFEISTDKVDTEIPSPVAGTLGDVLVQEGQTVQVNAIVARINDGSAVASAPAAKAAEPAPAPKQAAPPPPPPPPPAPAAAKPAAPPPPAPPPPPPAAEEPKEAAGLLSPLVRKMARENNIDLSKVAGTGAGGRITKEDVENYMQRPAPVATAASAPASVPAPASPAVPIGQAQPTAKSRIEPMSNMRIKIAEHMVASKRISAHVTTVHRVDMTRVAKMRAKHKEDFAARYGMSLTFLPFVARAAVEALRAFPVVNASIDGTNIVYHNEINLGIAVALDNGLIVPVIRNADEKTVLGLQRAIVDLASRARARQLKPDEIQAGTFSITNFGSFGSVFATPIINQPQVAILGVGAVEKVPVVVDDAIAIRSQCFLALTFDHRLIDGALGDQFTGKIKSILENWSEEVL
jgi:2-oxoglutarate dehydrogenase E2 component (dihydrolipoamide succinyltransferase)